MLLGGWRTNDDEAGDDEPLQIGAAQAHAAAGDAGAEQSRKGGVEAAARRLPGMCTAQQPRAARLPRTSIAYSTSELPVTEAASALAEWSTNSHSPMQSVTTPAIHRPSASSA